MTIPVPITVPKPFRSLTPALALRRTGPGQLLTSKAGMIGIARSITRELGARGITANVVMPGVVLTDMFNEVSDEVQQKYMGTSVGPLRRTD